MAMVEVIEEYRGSGLLMYFLNMIKKKLMTKGVDMDKASADKMKEAKKMVNEKFLAAFMLNGANREKYGKLKHSMAENYLTGTSKYPVSPKVVLPILNAYIPKRRDGTFTSNRTLEVWLKKGQCLPSQMEITHGKQT
jgi:hypothetical protein